MPGFSFISYMPVHYQMESLHYIAPVSKWYHIKGSRKDSVPANQGEQS